MKPSASALVCATLAVLAAPAYSADLFTVTRFYSQPTISRSDANGGVNVNFLGHGVETPLIDATPPGSHVPLAVYTVTTSGTPGPLSFYESFTLSALVQRYPGGATEVLVFEGTISGTASSNQNALSITLSLTPSGQPEARTFSLAGTTFTVSDIRPSPPPLINDTQVPGFTSALFAADELATSIAAVAVMPTSVPAGGGAIGTVTLNKPAPAPGVRVRLVQPLRPSYERPKDILVPGGATSTVFPVVALLEGQTFVGAEYNGSLGTAGLDITATPRCLPADVDGDGVVELSDVVKALRMYAGLDPTPI